MVEAITLKPNIKKEVNKITGACSFISLL